jgi:hypothetical protein
MTETSQTASTGARSGPFAAAGPLIVSAANPRYFAVASANRANQPIVYLTGSHIWNNLHDGMGPDRNCVDAPEPFDFDAYLDFLNDHGHNFIRLWRKVADKLIVERMGTINFSAPFIAARPAVLYLKHVGQ